MPGTEKLVEFDAREMWLDFAEGWPLERRQQYLLRQDIVKPLSTDSMVWPSVGHAAQADARQDQLAALEVLEGQSPAESLPYWDWYLRQDLRVLRRFMQRQAVGGPYWIIAISVLETDPVSGQAVPFTDKMNYLEAASPTPAQRDPSWPLLGFDVSDGSLLSGLSNCGYTSEEMRVGSQEWAGHLNEHHLFEDSAVAWRFKEFCDGRVPEHQPFYVYGLWLVERVCTSPRQPRCN